MNDTSSDNVRNLGARVTDAGEGIGERVQSATATTAAAAGQAKKCWATRHSKLGRKRAHWRRTSWMRVVAPPDPFRGRSARTH